MSVCLVFKCLGGRRGGSRVGGLGVCMFFGFVLGVLGFGGVGF